MRGDVDYYYDIYIPTTVLFPLSRTESPTYHIIFVSPLSSWVPFLIERRSNCGNTATCLDVSDQCLGLVIRVISCRTLAFRSGSI